MGKYTNSDERLKNSIDVLHQVVAAGERAGFWTYAPKIEDAQVWGAWVEVLDKKGRGFSIFTTTQTLDRICAKAGSVQVGPFLAAPGGEEATCSTTRDPLVIAKSLYSRVVNNDDVIAAIDAAKQNLDRQVAQRAKLLDEIKRMEARGWRTFQNYVSNTESFSVRMTRAYVRGSLEVRWDGRHSIYDFSANVNDEQLAQIEAIANANR